MGTKQHRQYHPRCCRMRFFKNRVLQRRPRPRPRGALQITRHGSRCRPPPDDPTRSERLPCLVSERSMSQRHCITLPAYLSMASIPHWASLVFRALAGASSITLGARCRLDKVSQSINTALLLALSGRFPFLWLAQRGTPTLWESPPSLEPIEPITDALTHAIISSLTHGYTVGITG